MNRADRVSRAVEQGVWAGFFLGLLGALAGWAYAGQAGLLLGLVLGLALAFPVPWLLYTRRARA